MVDASDLIVVGRFDHVVESRTVDLVPEWGADGKIALTTVKVEVKDALKSNELPQGAFDFDLFVPALDLVPVVEKSLPKGQMLLFFIRDAGRLRLTSPVSYVEDRDGRVGVPLFAEEAWLTDLDGASFAGLVDQARTKAVGP